MMNSIIPPPILKPEVKAKIMDWIERHPDVWHKDEHGVCHFWWTQNLLAELGIDLYIDKDLAILLRDKM